MMKQAVILAAGEGQRLRPFTVAKPKVMLAIAGKPILQYVIESLYQNGIRHIVVVIGYCKEQVLDYIGSGEQFGVEVIYVTQERQLGTAHALAQAQAVTEKKFLVLPGDHLIEANTIASFVSAAPNAILLKQVDDPSRYGVVTTVDGRLKNIAEKPQTPSTNIVNTGIYAFSRDIFDLIESDLDIPDVLNKMVAQGKVISARETSGTWLDVAYPWDILRLNDTVIRKMQPSIGGTIEEGASVKGLVSIGKTTVIKANCYIGGPVVIGDNCEIGPNACILPATSIGNNVVISPFTEVKNSVIGDDVSIGPGCLIEDSVIDQGCVINSHFIAGSNQTEIKIDSEYHVVTIGAMLGEGCNLGSCVTAQPGVIVGSHSQVQAAKVISGRLPDRSLVM